MEVRVIHVGEDYWLVREGLDGPVYRFEPTAPYRPQGFAAERPWISPGDLIEIDEADLIEYGKT